MRFLRACLYWIACILAALLVSLLLTGCSSFEPVPYWTQDRQPVAVKAVLWSEVNPICNGVESWGCADSRTGIVTISKKAPPLLWSCLLEHEKTMHLERGYSHRSDGVRLGGIWCNETTFMMVPS